MRYIKNNIFLLLSLTAMLGFSFFVALAFIISLLPDASVSTNTRVILFYTYAFYLQILPVITTAGIIFTIIGFLKKENKKGLFLSLLLNTALLYLMLA